MQELMGYWKVESLVGSASSTTSPQAHFMPSPMTVSYATDARLWILTYTMVTELKRLSEGVKIQANFSFSLFISTITTSGNGMAVSITTSSTLERATTMI
jgi:hypothetical protein